MSNIKILFTESRHENTMELFKLFEKRTENVCFLTSFRIVDKSITNQFKFKQLDTVINLKKFKYFIYDDDIYKKEVYLVSRIKSIYEQHYNKNYNVIIPLIWNNVINYQPIFDKDIEYYMMKSNYDHSFVRNYTINTVIQNNIENVFDMVDDKMNLNTFINKLIRQDNINEILK